MNHTKSYPWKNFFVLLILSLIAASANLPYTNAMFGNVQMENGLTRESFLTASFLQSMILLSVTAFFGLFFSRKGGLATPFLDALVYRTSLERPAGKTLLISAVIGILAGLVLLFLNALFEPFMTYELAEGSQTPGLAASLGVCLYGGIAEEIMLRLFCVNLFIFVIRRFYHKETTRPEVIAIVLSALAFGLLHVLSGLQAFDMDNIFIIRTILLNMLIGLVFGLLYMKWGLLPAMAAHGVADIILHVLPIL